MSHPQPRRRLRAGFGGLLGGLLIAVTGPVLVAEPAAAGPAGDYRRSAFKATNEQRDNHDRVSLGGHDCLQKHARRQARRMARAERIWHQNLERVLRDCRMNFVGENVAAGYPTGRSVVVDGWMRSEGHRENILEPAFRRMGLAARRGDDGRWYAAQVFGRRS
jgi:uncharacterized protein YkwD